MNGVTQAKKRKGGRNAASTWGTRAVFNPAIEESRVKRPALDRNVKACCLCDGVAFRIVGRRGFCDGHRDEAYAAARASVMR